MAWENDEEVRSTGFRRRGSWPNGVCCSDGGGSNGDSQGMGGLDPTSPGKKRRREESDEMTTVGDRCLCHELVREACVAAGGGRFGNMILSAGDEDTRLFWPLHFYFLYFF